MSKSASKQRLLAILMTIIILLLGLNAYLFWDRTKQNKIIAEQTIEIDETTKLKDELNRKYYESLAELEEKRSDNTKLNELIDSQKGELRKQKEKITLLLKDSKNLKQAKAELDQIKMLTQKYIAQIGDLQKENEQLAQSNTVLAEEKNILVQEVAQERSVNDQLVAENEQLENEKNLLSSQTESLSRKVTLASSIKIDGLEAQGYKVNSGGKEAKRNKAKNIDRLRICFNTTPNNVVEPDLEQFFIRVVNPVGETITVDQEGSGVITQNATNRKIRYTKAAEIDYTSSVQRVCTEWDTNLSFSPGIYEIEVYNKGYLSGSTSLELK